MIIKNNGKKFGVKLSGYDLESGEIELESQKLQTCIETCLFDEKAGLFCDGLDKNSSPCRIHSVHSQTLAIMLDLKPDYHDNMLKSRILPFLCGMKLDVPLPSAFWSSYVLTVAREKGHCKEALAYIRHMWSPMIPFSTCTEVFNPLKGYFSFSHAWSAHPVFHLMNILGGVTQESLRWDRIIYKPYFAPELAYVSVTVPSPHGLIESRWERKADEIDITLKLPDGVVASIEIPGYGREISGNFQCRIPCT